MQNWALLAKADMEYLTRIDIQRLEFFTILSLAITGAGLYVQTRDLQLGLAIVTTGPIFFTITIILPIMFRLAVWPKIKGNE